MKDIFAIIMKAMKRFVMISFVGFCNLAFSQSHINTNIFGFSTNTTFTFHDINDSIFRNKVDSLSPKVLRFPGGFGNFYHLSGIGYGVIEEEVVKYHKGKLPKRVNGIKSYENRNNIKENYIEDFIVLASKIKSKVIVDANIITSEPEETIRIIEKLQENNIEVIGVELGSELSNRSYMHLIDGEKYIELAKNHAEVLKRYFPNLKLGAVAAPVTRNQIRHDNWNKLLKDEDFYDAIIIHSYAKVTQGKDKYGKMENEISEGKTKKEAFSLYRDRIIKYFNYSYPDEIKKNNEIFSNKPIWITEWNLQMSKITGNTLFQAIYVTNFLLEISVSEQLSNIELMTFHNLAGRDVSGSVIENSNGKLKTHTTFLAMHLISEIFNDDELEISKRELNNFCYIYTFVKNEDVKYYYIVNWSEDSQIINLKKSIEKSNIVEYYGSELYYSTGEDQLHYSNNQVDNLTKILIKPYSITLIKSEDD